MAEQTDPNVTIIPLIFDNAFLQVTRGDLITLAIDIGNGGKVASADLSDSERDQLIAALSKPVEPEPDEPE
jgi:hypothetical protein